MLVSFVYSTVTEGLQLIFADVMKTSFFPENNKTLLENSNWSPSLKPFSGKLAKQ